ncbi:unnamed protein product [Ostreobium quekettii]|uniref:Alcohol dehydrogenase n=1 Tax=Ostreobium quekettii TaxID=121088 RepID=A0A8S1IKK3_9CHLO|nr:unnamed protein product [Ostreobium quekettii]
MEAIWLEDHKLELKTDLPVPDAPGEALVRVLRAGICNTDLELVKGYYPYTGVLGHEFVGMVERGPEEITGKRVVGEINATCGGCRFCRSAAPTHCDDRTVLGIVGRHGAFARFLSLPAKNLHPVPDGISTDAAVFAEPLAAALEIQEQVAVGRGAKVLQVGDGKLGQLVGQTLLATGCDLSVVGRHPAKLARLERHGARTIDAGDVDAKSFDIAVEVTGNEEGFALAQRALRPRGTLVMKSTYAGRLSLDAASIVVDELTVVGSRCGPMGKAVEALGAGLEVEDLIEARYPLARGLDAFEHAGRRGALKVLLDVT